MEHTVRIDLASKCIKVAKPSEDDRVGIDDTPGISFGHKEDTL